QWLSKFAILGAAFAALPDADLFFQMHRGVSHSFGATALLMIIVAGVTRWVTGRVQWRWVALLGAAHASHIVMDWLGADPYAPAGLEALWPFSHRFYISGLGIFPPTEPRVKLPGAVLVNTPPVIVEGGVIAASAVFVFLARRTRRSRVLTSAPDSLQRPSA